jgi:hypothetical protein|tara:strand:+ start:1168 stop:1857 length:690 start_codon:yes stop_codon:yes gene_type:complete
MGFNYDDPDGWTPPANRQANYGDFLRWMGQYVAHGLMGVILADTRSPYRIIKVVNLNRKVGDLRHRQNNMQAEFFEEHWRENIEGLVKIYSFTYFTATKPMMKTLADKIAQGCENPLSKLQILDMEEGNEMCMWLMEQTDYVGLTHPDLSREEMIKRVAEAAYNISKQTGMYIGDLKSNNYGFRKDGSAVIFDFNLSEIDESWDGYIEKEHYYGVIGPASDLYLYGIEP